ncbi:type II toxin-antitoxin system death-on-curing family toxin [Cellulosimicrobium protaetiae]|uniref:Type II toxin-antitoxin system death-on-curing family toxin n=1 Tax=Cellulosimicrobium protaetiae TaxID=2587808 RepID=A0A6M5UFH6_9MICO|nr:type II toxin-antitoxin system death-on-curing family toxin [Cellulosimicrobium protaetiae]QJW36920.1 type II toxin-antitoxin system death-on-curing family toxin [Cellulosimicrobium protaetiae]
MVVYLDEDDLVAAATAFLGHPPAVRDYGLLSSALARPAASMFGVEAYPAFDEKAASLLLSLTKNHALIDGNKRLGWVATRLFYAVNGARLAMPQEVAYALVVGIAAGEIDEVAEVARELAGHVVRPES